MEILNRKAKFNYFIEEDYECGIELRGTEIKSIRNGSCNIRDSYAIIRNDEIFVINMLISKYQESGVFNHDETRMRKLLLHKKEILKLKRKMELDGYTLIPLKMYFKHNKVKVLIGLCKGKKNYDKRNTIKDREIKIKVARELKNY